jgi:hypothetical protein
MVGGGSALQRISLATLLHYSRICWWRKSTPRADSQEGAVPMLKRQFYWVASGLVMVTAAACGSNEVPEPTERVEGAITDCEEEADFCKGGIALMGVECAGCAAGSVLGCIACAVTQHWELAPCDTWMQNCCTHAPAPVNGVCSDLGYGGPGAKCGDVGDNCFGPRNCGCAYGACDIDPNFPGTPLVGQCPPPPCTGTLPPGAQCGTDDCGNAHGCPPGAGGCLGNQCVCQMPPNTTCGTDSCGNYHGCAPGWNCNGYGQCEQVCTLFNECGFNSCGVYEGPCPQSQCQNSVCCGLVDCTGHCGDIQDNCGNTYDCGPCANCLPAGNGCDGNQGPDPSEMGCCPGTMCMGGFCQ